MNVDTNHTAVLYRACWMTLMGLSEDEIVEDIRRDPPTDPRREMNEIEAYFHVQKITPPSAVLSRVATQVYANVGTSAVRDNQHYREDLHNKPCCLDCNYVMRSRVFDEGSYWCPMCHTPATSDTPRYNQLTSEQRAKMVELT